MSQTVKHEGHTISLTSDLEFKVTGPEFEDAFKTEFASLRDAKEAIDEAVQLAARAKIKARTTQISVLDELGEPATITGINRANRQLTGLMRDAGNVYPNVPWVKTALRELRKIEADVRSRQMQLRSIAIDAKRGYGRINVTDYDRLVDAFEKEVEEKTKQAEKGPPELKPVARGTRFW